ncbi:MAG: extracellular solute-binding protein [Oscillospiraceae bacterium]|jgi:ABC-type glycerol-3-phosphate transport system substrate-binding protein|nr:extracellular solute-binding protein [Oscillospiraceae bacterium]
MTKKNPLKLFSFVLAGCLLSVYCSSAGALQGESEARAAEQTEIAFENATGGYHTYLSAFSGRNFLATDAGATIRETGVFRRGDSVTLDVLAPADMLAELTLDYRCEKPQDIVLEMRINGEIPFPEAGLLTFPAFWSDAQGTRTDKAGNEFAPEQILYEKSTVSKARDYSGRYELPFKFVLTAGAHTVTLTVSQGEFVLKGAALSNPEQPGTYKAPEPSRNESVATGVIVLEGESPSLKNDRSLVSLSDGGSPAVSPGDPVTRKLNYIGGANWKKPGSALTWAFNVETAGYYSIGFNYRQNQLLGGVSYRHLAIDGQTPFEEARRVKFTYGSAWRYKTCGGESEPWLFWLDAGQHTITLTATAGAMSEIYSDLRDVTAQMGNLYVDITMIVGETVDIYRSYELFNQIPDFNGRLERTALALDEIAAKLEALQEKSSGSTVSLIRNAVRVIRQMLNNPYSAHRYKSGFYDVYTNLSALMGTMTDTPLDIDRIFIFGAGSQKPEISPSLLSKLGFSVKRFAATFMGDYSSTPGGGEDNETLNLWVSWGRDQAQALSAVIQDGFVPDSGIEVNVSLVNASLIQAILSGNGPDVMLQMARTEPVNYAMRGALYDLSRFQDLPQILERFAAGAAEPYKYDNGVWALPDTQSFYMMFLRTDILNSLGIDPPETWEDFVAAATLLQRSNLQAYLPYTQITDSGTVNTGVGGLTLFPTLLIQSGLPLYNAEQTASTLTQIGQIQVFTEWADWYTKYKLPKTMDFYNRFRIGSAPLGISPYTLYTQLKAAAPEIDGRWTVAPISGTRKADGTVDHSSAGSGTGCAITKLSKNPENAWKFLKWWISPETQLRYSADLESVLGPLGRIASSNLEAFRGMNWDADMLEQMVSQHRQTVELPEIPGGYYTARGIDQAFWSVVEQGNPPADSLQKWGAVVDREIARKRAEYPNGSTPEGEGKCGK